jgi:O-antigen/teichoic acid export membrane protein
MRGEPQPGARHRTNAVSLKRNLFANYLGQGWTTLMGFLFIPLYIKYMGIESFALVGIFAMLQAWLALLDMGMKPALQREMARFSAGKQEAGYIRDLLRSVETVGLGVALAIATGIWAASGWLATDWLGAEKLAPSAVAGAIAWMFLVVGARFIENIYINSIIGLQRQVVQNVLGSSLATLRGAGAVGVLAWISPTISAYFIWQGLVSLVSIISYSALVYRSLPDAERAARFSLRALARIWRFAAGMLVITLLTLLLTQVDKILLTRLLTLQAFAFYALAAMVANALRVIPSPITTAIYPRLTRLAAHGTNPADLSALYHHGAQLVTVLMGAAAIMLMAFSERILLLWTNNPLLSQEAAPLLAVLALGTLLNGLMWVPYQLQLAHGWTSLAIRVNAIAVAILVPAILWVVPLYGALGAAWAWVVLNAGYLVFEIHFMHRRLLDGEKWRWYRQDLALPLGAAGAAALLCQWLMPNEPGKFGEFAVLVISTCLVMGTAALAAPLIREQLRSHALSVFPS